MYYTMSDCAYLRKIPERTYLRVCQCPEHQGDRILMVCHRGFPLFLLTTSLGKAYPAAHNPNSLT